MLISKKYTVYCFLDNLEVPFYVGYTHDLHQRMRRHNYHVMDFHKKSKQSAYPYYEKARDLLRLGFFYKVRILASNLCESQADFLERIYISRYRRTLGIALLNKLSGGRTGQRGKVVSECTKRKISEAKKGKPLSAAHRRALRKPHVMTPEGLARIREKVKRGKDHPFHGKSLSKDHIEKIRKAKTGVSYSAESNKKKGKKGKEHSTAKKYRIVSPENVEYVMYGISREFCNRFDLNYSGLWLALHRKNNNYKGWRVWLIA